MRALEDRVLSLELGGRVQGWRDVEFRVESSLPFVLFLSTGFSLLASCVGGLLCLDGF